MLIKEKVIASLNNFPESFSIDDLIEKLIIIDKIDLANQQSLNNEVISEIELEKDFERWFK